MFYFPIYFLSNFVYLFMLTDSWFKLRLVCSDISETSRSRASSDASTFLRPPFDYNTLLLMRMLSLNMYMNHGIENDQRGQFQWVKKRFIICCLWMIG